MMESSPGRGFIPPTVDLSHIRYQPPPERFMAVQADPQYDWRTTGKVTSVKNQSTCGACYAFASLANIESKMLIDGEGTLDFSENNAKECNYYDASCSGGNYLMMADLFSQKGVVLESCDAYVAGDVSCNTSCPYIKTLLDWRIISTDAVPSTTTLQNYIQTYGPVYTTLYAGDANDASWDTEFNNYDGSYTLYYTGSYTPNHAVLIVGWDNDIIHAGGSGAWIVKNSWGTGWGGTCGYGAEGGYFTIAYGSANIGQYSSYIYDWQDYDDGGVLFNYDDGGWGNYWGYGSTTGWGMCEFTADDDIDLTRVEFWTTDATTDIDIYIYDDFVGGTLSSLLASKENNAFDEAGYHSVSLDEALQVSNGDDIYVAVKFTNASFEYPIVADNNGPLETGKTYISGSGSSWYDLGSHTTPSDVAIRIRGTASLAQSIDEENELTPGGYSLEQNYPNPFNAATTIKYSLQEKSNISLSVFNILGQKVATLIETSQPAGNYELTWNGLDYKGRPVSSGVYYYRLSTDGCAKTRKMLLLK